MKFEISELPSTIVTRISAQYAENFPLQSLIQLIPGVGGSLNTMLSGLGARWQHQRLVNFVHTLSERLEALENTSSITPIETSEEFYDLTIATFNRVIKTRSADKISRFANIFARQIVQQTSWDEADAALTILDSLSDAHIEILSFAVNAPPCEGVWNGLRVVSTLPVSEQNRIPGPLHIRLSSSNPPLHLIRLYCSELVSKGLMHDEGVGRIEVKSVEYLIPTDLAEWFIQWIREDSS